MVSLWKKIFSSPEAWRSILCSCVFRDTSCCVSRLALSGPAVSTCKLRKVKHGGTLTMIVCSEKVDLRSLYSDRPWETRNLTWCALFG
eukprot:1141768-Pelagomonas_calceolata.AAC.4